jgi:hypothetical protein
MGKTRVWVPALVALAGACRSSNTVPANAPATAAVGPTAAYPAPPPGYPAAYPTTSSGGAPPSAAPGYAPQPGSAQPPTTAPPPGYPTAQPQPPATTASSASPVVAPSGPLAPADPNTLQAILAGIQGALQGTLVLPGSLPADLTQAGLKAQALRLAPGMQPEGEQLKQNLTEGQHAVMMVTLQAGKCYSILGYSPPGGVKDLDLNLLAPPFFLTLAGQDLTHNSAPSIGAAPNPMCPVIALPLQYKLDVFARLGSGQVAVQLYSKAK